ncbi:hypothetical protein HanXRQr2_Chr05g0228981 [Helianthus annuus]|uniref:Uncharacterized protein n=1 Tax=Helianthus annuus TaxID=4232 RepID=A0A251UTK4_HELAN|nr:hypothetical protein HanXRQr2_Chr05g0228981 [Helianthus annuus]
MEPSLEPRRLRATCLTPPTGSDHRQPCQPHATGHASATMRSRTCPATKRIKITYHLQHQSYCATRMNFFFRHATQVSFKQGP